MKNADLKKFIKDRNLLCLCGYWKNFNLSVKYRSTYLVNTPRWYKNVDGHPKTRMVSPLIWIEKLSPVIYNSGYRGQSIIKRKIMKNDFLKAKFYIELKLRHFFTMLQSLNFHFHTKKWKLCFLCGYFGLKLCFCGYFLENSWFLNIPTGFSFSGKQCQGYFP